MKTTNHRLHRLSAIILSTVFVFISCTKVTTPEPSENPVFLTYEAQTKKITVKYLHNIVGEYSSVEDYLIIENDWVRFTQLKYVGSNTKAVQIDVKANTTSQPRTYALELNSGTDSSVLTVTQAGKP